MPVTDFECQIARGQIGRYLDGGALSPQALTSLEEHLSECPGCKAAVAERRAKLLGTLGAPTQAVVSMPIDNPLVAALRARAEAEPVPSKPSSAVKSEPAVKASPRYAKAAPAKKGLGKPLALAALLAAVLLGMGRLSHTATAPAAKASTAFAAESLPESSPLLMNRKSLGTPTVVPKAVEGKATDGKSPLPDGKGVEAHPTQSSSATSRPAMPQKPSVAKASHPAPKAGNTWGDLFRTTSKTNPDAREVSKSAQKPRAAKVRAAKRESIVAKPKVRVARPKLVRTRVRSVVRRAAKAAHRAKASRRAPRTTVRVYGLDGRPLKP